MKKAIKNYWAIIIPITTLIIGGIFLFKKSDAAEENYIVGMVEAEYTDIASEVPGRIDSLLVAVGDTVKKGQLLALIKKTEIDNLQQQSLYSIDAAKSQLELLQNGARPEAISSAKNLVGIAQHQYDLAKQSFERMSKLFADNVISGQEKDMMEFKFQAAQKELEMAKSHLQSLEKGSRIESIQAAKAFLNKAEQSYELTKDVANNTRIYANANGIVTSLIINEGELANLGYPMMTLQKENSMTVQFNIKQDQMALFSEGKKVKIKIPGASPEIIHAKVIEVAPNLTYANWVPEEQLGQFEMRTFSIKCKPTQSVKNLRAGMTGGFAFDKIMK